MRGRALLLLAAVLAAAGVGRRLRESTAEVPPPLPCAELVSLEADGREQLLCAGDPALARCSPAEPGARYRLLPGEPARCERTGTLPAPVLRLRHLPVPVNAATVEDLRALPGVGSALAQRIVEARGAGGYCAPGDLQRVPGIGPRRAEALAPHLSFGGCEAAPLEQAGTPAGAP